MFIILAISVRDGSCREKLAPISPKGQKFVAQTIKGIQPNLLLTCKFHRGVTENQCEKHEKN